MLAVMMVSMLSLGIASCGGDDDDDDDSSSSSYGIVGTWSGVNNYNEKLDLTINKGGDGSYIITDEYYKEVVENGKITYTFDEDTHSEGTIIFIYHDKYYKTKETSTYYFEIEGKEMSIYDGNYHLWDLTKK